MTQLSDARLAQLHRLHAMRKKPRFSPLQQQHFALYISHQVARHFGIEHELLRDRTKKQEVVEARHVAMYVIHRCTLLPYGSIGRHLNRKNHTSVMHALGQVRARIDTIPGYAELVDLLEAKASKYTGIRPARSNAELRKIGWGRPRPHER